VSCIKHVEFEPDDLSRGRRVGKTWPPYQQGASSCTSRLHLKSRQPLTGLCRSFDSECLSNIYMYMQLKCMWICSCRWWKVARFCPRSQTHYTSAGLGVGVTFLFSRWVVNPFCASTSCLRVIQCCISIQCFALSHSVYTAHEVEHLDRIWAAFSSLSTKRLAIHGLTDSNPRFAIHYSVINIHRKTFELAPHAYSKVTVEPDMYLHMYSTV
jgi:hypothetical protein